MHNSPRCWNQLPQLAAFWKKKVQMFAFKKGRFQVFDMQTCLRVSWQPTLDNSLPDNGTSTAPQVQHNQLTLKWAWDAFQAKRPKNPVWTTNRCLCKIMERIRVVSNRVLHSNPQLSNGCVSDGIANVTKPGYTNVAIIHVGVVLGVQKGEGVAFLWANSGSSGSSATK